MVFALVAGTAFAEITGGGGFVADVVQGNSVAKNTLDTVTSSFGKSWWSLGAKVANEENTAGGKVGAQIVMAKDGIVPSFEQYGSTFFYAFWQPIPQLFIKVGKLDEDNKYWAGAGVNAWGYQSNSLRCDIGYNDYNGGVGNIIHPKEIFFSDKPTGGRWDNYSGLQVSLLPLDGLALNFSWNLGTGNFKRVFGEVAGQVVYKVGDIGTAAVAFSNTGLENYKPKYLFAQWSMPLLDTMSLELGARFQFHAVSDSSDDAAKEPIQLGLGFKYSADAFWITSRLDFEFGTDPDKKDPTKINFQLCPSFDLEIFRVYIPMGIAFKMQDGQDTLTFFVFNPYIRKSLGGGVNFWAGFQLYNGLTNNNSPAKADADLVKWAIPISIDFSL